MQGPFSRHSLPNAAVALVCVTADRERAELASQCVATGLMEVGVASVLRLWAHGRTWVELNTGVFGNRSEDAAGRIAATAVLAGVAQPVADRTSLAPSLVGDEKALEVILPAVRQTASVSTYARERVWSLARLERFHTDGRRLSDLHAARLLLAVQTVRTRDGLWQDLGQENCDSHVALWADLTRRAPAEVRAAPAVLLGFASWVEGNGARAWCALDRVPPDQPYALATTLASILRLGLHPREWDRARIMLQKTVGDLDESFPDATRPSSPRSVRDSSGRCVPWSPRLHSKRVPPRR